MARFVVRRLLLMVPLGLGVTFVTFALVNLIPGSPVADTATLRLNPRLRPEDVARIERTLGLDRPWPVRYLAWLGDLLRGDLGLSLFNAVPVRDRILAVLPNTLLLTGAALAFALALALPLGVWAARHRDSGFDRAVQLGAVVSFALPPAWIALVLVIVGALKFREWGLPALPAGGTRDLRDDGGLLDRLEHLILPAVALGLLQVGFWTTHVRAAMLDALGADHVRTARAKGLRERTVLFRHAARTAVFPLVTLVGLSLPHLFGGAVLIESVFAWNGVGLLTVNAVNQRDHTVVMGTTLMLALLTMVGNLAADVLYGVLDPRTRHP